jgi:hypothetical protein
MATDEHGFFIWKSEGICHRDTETQRRFIMEQISDEFSWISVFLILDAQIRENLTADEYGFLNKEGRHLGKFFQYCRFVQIFLNSCLPYF